MALFSFIGLLNTASSQTNFAVIIHDGAWTWFNDPRAVYHNSVLYVGYVRNSDGRSALSAFNPATGAVTDLWTSTATQKDDHNNPGLLVKQDGTMLAIHARHGADQFFYYRLSTATNPVTPGDWSAEMTITNTGAGVTYANPFQLRNESGKIYNFMRDLNFNPTVVTSTNGGTNWSAAQLFIQNGTGSTRPYVKYCSDYTNRIDYLYTDGHPRDVTNSLYHLFYSNGSISKTDGTLVKSYSALPIMHEAGERGSVIYQYSDVPTNDANVHIPTGRAWCWQVGYQPDGKPVCVFSVQRDQVTGTNWYDGRIYYYYARWTGTNWQKRFIAQGGRPLYTPETDYAGGICFDPENPNVVYFSSNAQNPLNLASTTNVSLNANSRYELFRGVTTNGGLSFTWQAITTNSTADNLRPYIPPRHDGKPMVLWFRGTYTTFTAYSCDVVGLFSDPAPQPPRVEIISPKADKVAVSNLSNELQLRASIADDGVPGPATVSWATTSGPTSALFADASNKTTSVRFPQPGIYTLRITADDGTIPQFSEITVIAAGTTATNEQVLHLKLDETNGTTASDSSGYGNVGTVSGTATWRPQNGIRNGAIELDGATSQVVVPDADALDNTSSFTLCFWFLASAYPGDSGGLVCKRNNISDNNAFTTYLKTSDHRIYVDIDGGNNRFSSATPISTNQWYHVALVYDGTLATAQRAKLWIDGAVDVIASETSATIPNYTSSVRIGNTHGGATNLFKGLIDDVRFYRRALQTNEIVTLATAVQAPAISFAPVPSITNRLSAFLTTVVDPPATPVEWSHTNGPGIAKFSASNSLTTGITFNRSGDHVLAVAASNAVVESVGRLALYVQPNTNVFSDWTMFFFPGVSDPTIIGESADVDGDGLSNFAEFAVGLDPTDANDIVNGGNKPRAEIFGDYATGTSYLALHYKRPSGRFEIEYSAEASSDFVNWSPTVEVLFTPSLDGTEEIIYRDTVPINSAPARFLTLRVRPL